MTRRPTRRAIADEVSEGLLLLDHTVRMRLRNRIIVDTLTAAGPVDGSTWAFEAGTALRSLWREAEASADRMSVALRSERVRVRGRASDEHDYRPRDAANLRRRRRVYRLVAARLRAWESDPVRVADLVGRARDEAREEIAAEICRVVGASGEVAGDDAGVLRERLDLITDVPPIDLGGRPPG